MAEITKENYQKYLLTSHWKDFAFSIKAQRRQCERCGCNREQSLERYRQNLHIHHKTYERVGCELPSDVEVLCFACHLAGEHESRDLRVMWKALAGKMAMPAVTPITESAKCVNCEKVVAIKPLWNVNELRILEDFLCRECS